MFSCAARKRAAKDESAIEAPGFKTAFSCHELDDSEPGQDNSGPEARCPGCIVKEMEAHAY